MKERPILFSGHMIRAILEGRKTMTRRVIKPQPVQPYPDAYFDAYNKSETWCWWTKDNRECNGSQYIKCPYGQPGDRLWVRETWARYNIDQDGFDIAYRATTPKDWPEEGNWRPSIHMPRLASRITLEIVSVRVERLNDISEQGAMEEGIERMPYGFALFKDYLHDGRACDCRPSFASLWESINGPGSWQQNPWVWVVEFKVVQP